MKPQLRHQRIMDLLAQFGTVSVSELAERLVVSENTVRNDLDLLAEEGLLARTHGGAAMLKAILPPTLRPFGSVLSEQVAPILDYAITWVKEGDSLILDNSPLIVMLAERMTQHKHLRVITPSLAVAYLLAQEPTNRVVVAGGEFNPKTLSTSGAMVETAIQSFHASKAFISVTGVSIQNGLTDSTSESAHVKRLMRAAAETSLVLVESSRMGKADLFPVGSLNDAQRIVTDVNLESQAVQSLADAGARVTVCWNGGHQTYRQKYGLGRNVRIGFANLSNDVIFASAVLKGLWVAAAKVEGLELQVADNRTDGETAVRNARELLDKDIDLLVEYEGTGMAIRPIRQMAREAEVPVIAVDIPILGATHIGTEHDAAGVTAGRAMARWVRDHWDGQIDQILWITSLGGATLDLQGVEDMARLEEWRSGNSAGDGLSPNNRFTSAMETLLPSLENRPHIHELVLSGGWATSEEATRLHFEQVTRVMPKLAENERIAVFCLVCETALAFARAARNANRCSQFALVSFGNLSQDVKAELARPDSCFSGIVDLHPEAYGETIITTAVKLLRGEAVPPAIFIEHSYVSSEEVQSRGEQPDPVKA